jgi:hypothetical protein
MRLLYLVKSSDYNVAAFGIKLDIGSITLHTVEILFQLGNYSILKKSQPLVVRNRNFQ